MITCLRIMRAVQIAIKGNSVSFLSYSEVVELGAGGTGTGFGLERTAEINPA